MVAFSQATADVPAEVRDALQDAMEIATRNVPSLDESAVYVFPDISGSMRLADHRRPQGRDDAPSGASMSRH